MAVQLLFTVVQSYSACVCLPIVRKLCLIIDYAYCIVFFQQYKLHLDTVENRALIGHTALEVLLCATTFGGYLSTGFGMNLDNDTLIQNIKGGFVVVTAVCTLYMVIIYYAIMFIFAYTTKIFPRIIVTKLNE